MKPNKYEIEYEPEIINCLITHKVKPDDLDHVNTHFKECFACQKSIRDNQFLSKLVTAGIDKELSEVNLDVIQSKVIKQIRHKQEHQVAFLELLQGYKKFYFPLASTVVLLFILTYAFFYDSGEKSFPSAIVDSISGQVSSVMIMETQQTRKTVIWFNETS